MSLDRNSVRDANIDYKMAKETLYPRDYELNSLTTGINTFTLAELGSANIGALRISATGSTVDAQWWSNQFDNLQPIYIRHLWTSDQGGTDGNQAVLIRTRYNTLSEGSAAFSAATVLTVAIASSTKGTPVRALKWTPWGKLAPLATGAHAGQLFPHSVTGVIFGTDVTAVNSITLSSQYVYLVKTEIAYTPRQTFGDGSRREARQMADDLSGMEAGPTIEWP